MNTTARLPSPARAGQPGSILAGLGAALRDTAAFIFVREAHAYYVRPPAHRHPVSRRAGRFMRGGE